jgi:penicillin amidase
VDGTLTASGKPLLANDPHLATRVPSLWYLAHLSAGDFDVIGATLPGAPAMAIGRNRHIAWGETNMFADVEDLYRERLDPAGKNAEFAGALEPLRILDETIAVSGKAPVTVTVRITRHGPLVSDAINANNAESDVTPKPLPIEPLAFRWTALDDQDDTVVAFLKINEATNWTDFTAALRSFVVPSQNFVYADVDGHIGYYAPGRVPIRASGDGSIPAEGWTGAMEWTGWIPFDGLPHAYDPPNHFIVTANNRPVPADYPHAIGLDYLEPFRAQRITDLIRQKNKLTPEDFRAIQADTFSSHAQALLPLLLRRVHASDTTDLQALALLRRWNYDARGDRAEPAIFEAWFVGLARSLIVDELGRPLTDVYERRFTFVHRFLTQTLTAGDSAWCNDVATPETETCDEAVTSALHDAVETLRRSLGDDVLQWRWEDVHRAVFPHALDSIGALRPLLSRSRPSAGDWSTVNVGAVAVDRPFLQTEVPGYRQIVDLSPANDSRFLDAVGQSGHFLSPHYADFLDDWRAVRHKPMRMDRARIEHGAIGHLTLTPR